MECSQSLIFVLTKQFLENEWKTLQVCKFGPLSPIAVNTCGTVYNKDDAISIFLGAQFQIDWDAKRWEIQL